jgi:hypothetical protein
MIGYHSVSVIADAMIQSVYGLDYFKAFEASKASAMRDVLGLDAYKKNGFISIDDDHESVSKTLEYAYDDWCIAQMAHFLGKKEDYQYFMKRSQNWKNLFNWETGFIQPKKNGGWDKSFDPREINNNYTEANGWQYTFFVPHDVFGLIEAIGGAEKFEAKLDEMFNSVSKTTGREQVDVTGLIGQYAHGNEPSHHVAYLYNYIGKPEKTKEKVHYILENFYKNAPDGLIGNEDCGQMSAWYVMSSIGMYSICPEYNEWLRTKPFFSSQKINFEDGSYWLISENDDYENFGLHKEMILMNRLNNSLVMRDAFYKDDIVTVPVIEAESKAFKEELPIQFKTWNKSAKVFYSINGKPFSQYQSTFTIKESAIIRFYSDEGKGRISDTISAQFFKKPNNYTIDIKSKYNPQYHAGGPDALLDGIYGNENWRKGEWHGYQNQDFEAVIDLQKEIQVNELSANFLQDTRAWILMPTQVEFYVSNDNQNFMKVATVENKVDAKDYEVQLQKLTAKVSTKARYVKVIARNFGALPEWHQGFPFDGDAFIFVDEIEVN